MNLTMLVRVFFSFLFWWFSIAQVVQARSIPSVEEVKAEIIMLVNQRRISLGLAPFETAEIINSEARKHSTNMASGRVKVGTDGFNQRIAAIKREIGGNSFAENVASRHVSDRGGFAGLISNHGQQRNIEGDFTHMGVGVAKTEKGTYFLTQIFVKVDPNTIINLTGKIAERLEIEIVELVNRHRATLGLRPMNISKEITKTAVVHSQNMASGKVGFSHQGADKRVAEIRKVIGGVGFAENIAYGQPTAQSVVEAWLNSPGHRRNIEGDFTHIGVGIAQKEDKTLYYTQIFVKLRN